ncbi:unnamed protein product [Urochloa humidicola]
MCTVVVRLGPGPGLHGHLSLLRPTQERARHGGAPPPRGHPSSAPPTCTSATRTSSSSARRFITTVVYGTRRSSIATKFGIKSGTSEMKRLVEEGKIKYIGLSEASASTIRRAHAVQLEWSIWSRDVKEDVIPTCRELEIGIVATVH